MSVSIPMSSGAVAAGVAAAADPAPLGAVATGIDHIFIAGTALGVVALVAAALIEEVPLRATSGAPTTTPDAPTVATPVGVVAPTPARCAPQPSGPVPGAGCPPPLTTSLNLKGTP